MISAAVESHGAPIPTEQREHGLAEAPRSASTVPARAVEGTAGAARQGRGQSGAAARRFRASPSPTWATESRRSRARIADGLRYCRAGVDREIWRAENHLNLARTYLLAGKPKRAIAALDYGLGLEPTNAAMLELRLKLGVRRSPTFPFLDRGHPLNRIAGKLRHRLAGFEMPSALPAPKSARDPV